MAAAVGFPPISEHRRMRGDTQCRDVFWRQLEKFDSTLNLRYLFVGHLEAELATQLNSVRTLTTRNPRVPAKTNLLFITGGKTLRTFGEY